MSAIDNRNYIKTFHDFDIFKGCFGNTKIMPSDLDFIVERNNKFLCMELKPEYKILFKGQEILLKRLSRVPNFTVAIIYHKSGRTLHETFIATAMQVYPDGKRIEINNNDLITFVTKWFDSI